ncbi:hypothetical protein AZSP09_33640 [Azospira sp. I09]|nr:hypothetical protein AZSP09_33640 [Azospira sp. I09]
MRPRAQPISSRPASSSTAQASRGERKKTVVGENMGDLRGNGAVPKARTLAGSSPQRAAGAAGRSRKGVAVRVGFEPTCQVSLTI